jgi:hypothetical protein
MKNILFLSISTALIISACTYTKKNASATPTPVNTTGGATTAAVSYSVDIKPIMVTYCLGTGNQSCHVTPSNQGANGDFTTYAGLDAKVLNGSIQARVFNANGGMPASYSNGPTQLSAADKTKFMTWVTNGAPNN